MSVRMALLAMLDSGGSSHGFVLKQRYDSLFPYSGELKYGQVYSTLARLERDGLTAGVGVEKGEGADRRVYAITEDGVHELDAWLSRASFPGGRPSELFTRVVLAIVSGRPAEEVLAVQRAAYLARMREITASRHDGDAIDRLAGDFEMAHLEADLRWVELAGTRLEGLAAEVGPRPGAPS
jgi:DNA-binding PadR family transcriptional regulator